MTATSSETPPQSAPDPTAATQDGSRGADVPTDALPDPGAPDQRLGRYTVIRMLGQGGMGVVYAAYDDRLDRRVAIKLVRTDNRGSDAHARILREAKALAQLSHPNVVQIYEVSASAGRVFLAMEYVRGTTLGAQTQRPRGAPPPSGPALRRVLDLYIQAGRGLSAAHAEGLVHRDFKPDNVLVGEDGRARVIDFGLATLLEPEASAPTVGTHTALVPLTVESVLLGTPAYMSPEQLAGRPADARSDQFGFCVALYEAIAGVRPFAGENLVELADAIERGSLRAPEALPRWLLAILQRGLAARPSQRFPSLDDLLGALASDPEATRGRRRRIAALVLASAAIAAALAVLTIEQRSRWADLRREREADQARLATEARIAEANAAANEVVAREAFAAFVDDPAHDGTEALARAWLDAAERHRAGDDLDGARAGFAAAYADAPTLALQLEALRGLAGVLRLRLDWGALAGLLDLVDRDHPASAAGFRDLRVDVALARRDLADAGRQLGELGDPADVRAALTTSLLPASATALRDPIAVYPAGPHLAVIEQRGDRPVLHLVRRDRALSLVGTYVPPEGTDWLFVVSSDPLRIAGYDNPPNHRNTLYELADGALRPLHTWHGDRVFAGASADLDGDGARELYLGAAVGLEILEVVETADGPRERVVYDETDTLESMPIGMLTTDLDGDGREELAVSFIGWRAYDVRLLARGADRRLVTAARDKIGTVVQLATLRGPDGRTRLLFNNSHGDENSLVFPPGGTRGDAEGFYLLGHDGHRLTRDLHLPRTRLRTATPQWFPGLFVGDLDGDGRDDFAASFHDGVGNSSTLVHVQGQDGAFTPALIGHVVVHAAEQLDEDPADELIVALPAADRTQSVWVLGAGDDALPPVPLAPTPTLTPVDSDDPAWNRRWRQAAAIAELGLHDDAAIAFERLARGAPTPALRATAALAAGKLRARFGEHRPALALLHEAARAPEHHAEALREALTSELRLGDYEAAQVDLDALVAGGGEVPGPLARVVERARQERLEIRFDRPLDPAWRFDNPLAVRHAPGDAALTVANHESGALMSLPVEWSGDLIEIAVDVTLLDTEYPAGLEVAIDGTSTVSAYVGTAGTRRSGMNVHREYLCYALGENVGITHPIATGPADASRFEIRISIHPQLGEIGCDLTDAATGVSRSYIRRLEAPLPAPGRRRLVIRGLGVGPSWVRAQIHRITARGVRQADEPASDRAAFHRALVESDPAAASAAFAALSEPTAREQLWGAHALLQAGRLEAARAAWSRVLVTPEPPTAVILHLLRAHPELYGPLLREPLGDRYLALLADAWRPTATNHIDDTRARRALHTALAPLDAAALLAATDPGPLARACELLGWRARVHARDGDGARARADFEGVLAAIDRLPADDPVRSARWQLWLDLASLAALAGRGAQAGEAVRSARAATAMPSLVDDVVRAHPELAPYIR